MESYNSNNKLEVCLDAFSTEILLILGLRLRKEQSVTFKNTSIEAIKDTLLMSTFTWQPLNCHGNKQSHVTFFLTLVMAGLGERLFCFYMSIKRTGENNVPASIKLLSLHKHVSPNAVNSTLPSRVQHWKQQRPQKTFQSLPVSP